MTIKILIIVILVCAFFFVAKPLIQEAVQSNVIQPFETLNETWEKLTK